MTSYATGCPKCGGPLDEGRLEDSVLYVSDRARAPSFWSLDPKVYVTRARACLACGYVELFLDPQQLRKYVQEPEP
jgi:hypothetical protein